MPTITREETERRVAVFKAALAAGQGMAHASRILGLSPNAGRGWWNDHNGKAPIPDAPEIQPIPVSPREIQDAAFWRRKAGEASARAEKAEHLAEELMSVRGVPIDPTPWDDAPAGERGRSIGIVHTSDGHAGEVIRAGEILGSNAFDPDIYKARMARVFNTACAMLPRWFDDDICDGILLTMAGDLISGDIHDELMATNGLTSHQQVRLAVETYETGILQLADKFSAVHVVAVPGNHGRITKKPWAKLSGNMSYDTLIAGVVRDRLRDDDRVTWTISEGADAMVPVYGRSILVTHGDRMGTGGGQGFIGAELPILRGALKVKAQLHGMGQQCDLILCGHFHTSINGRGVLANGSVPGYSEYGNAIRSSVEPPKQWIARFSMRYGLADRLDVQLTEPKAKMKAKAA